MLTVQQQLKPKSRLNGTKVECPKVDLGLGITAQIMEITPAMAEDWLGGKFQIQRSISKTSVETLVRLITDGKWKLNGATIVFNDENPPALSDGQHRLTACVKSGSPIVSLVLSGVPEDSFWTMDTGRKRTGADAVSSCSFQNSSVLAAAAQLLWRYENGKPLYSGGAISVRLQPMEIAEVVQTSLDLVDAIPFARPAFSVMRSAGAAVFCFCVLNRVDHDDAVTFFSKLGTGENLVKGDSILELRRRLLNSPPVPERICLVFKAWNAFRNNQNVMALRVDMKQPFPQPI